MACAYPSGGLTGSPGRLALFVWYGLQKLFGQEPIRKRDAGFAREHADERPSAPGNPFGFPSAYCLGGDVQTCPVRQFLANGLWAAELVDDVGMSAHADQNKATLYRVNKNVFIGDKAELWHALGMPPKPSPNAKPRDPKNVAAGQRFRIFREAVLGWPQKASFARHMGWSQQRFGQWENGVHPFPLAELQKVEERFGVRLLDWVYNNDIARLEKHQIDKLNDPRLVPAAGDKD